jgi:ABC-type Fe3+-hydroxamate transport system substrate-binding protein
MLFCIHNHYVRDKRAKFVELANKRVTKCIRELKLVGNLSNKAAYDFTDEDAKKIVKALQKEVDSIRARFADISGTSNLDFSL